MGNRAPNDVQKVLLESLDLKLEGGHVCRKFTPLDFAPTDRQTWVTSGMNAPAHCLGYPSSF